MLSFPPNCLINKRKYWQGFSKIEQKAIVWIFINIKGINPSFCAYNILMEDDFRPSVQHQRRHNLLKHTYRLNPFKHFKKHKYYYLGLLKNM